MRKWLTLFIALLAGAVLFTGTASAMEQEQLIHEQFGTGSYATWKTEKKGWDKGAPGTNQTTGVHEYTFPSEKLSNYEITRVEARGGYEWDPQVYENAGGWNGFTYDDYLYEILPYTPDNLKVTKTSEDLAAGKVDIVWSLTLNPTLSSGGREARNTVDPNTRQHLKQLGFNLEEKDVYDKAFEGWLWCLPVHIRWYGVPQAVPDFSVQFDRDFIQQPPGSAVNTGVTYKLNANHDKAETAKLELFQQREDGSLVKRITPPDSVVREFQPGEAYRVPVSLQMSTIDTDIIAVIRPVSTATDRDWDNNRDELWLWPDEEAPELPGGDYVTPKEGDKIHVELGGSGRLSQIKPR